MSVLYVNDYGASLGVQNERVQVRRDRKVVQEMPLLHLERIVLMAPANITQPAVRLLMERGIDIVYLSPNGTFYGQFTRGDGAYVELRLAQFRKFHDRSFRLLLAKTFVAGKIANMLALWRRQLRHGDLKANLEPLERIHAQIARAPSLETLLGFEGAATACHFKILRSALHGEWKFERRLHHPSPDPINAMLSLGYTLLYSRMSGLLQMHGLDPFLGFFHEPKRGHAALASDMIEEWRGPIVDALVLNITNSRQMAPADFQKSGRECRMKRDALKKIRFGVRAASTRTEGSRGSSRFRRSHRRLGRPGAAAQSRPARQAEGVRSRDGIGVMECWMIGVMDHAMKHDLAKRIFVVVAYDISDDKRRALLHRKLKAFGLAVQYSVFECLLNRDQIAQMKKMVRANIKPKAGDRVRYYFLCESCRRRIQATDAVTQQDAPVVFA